MKRWQAESLSVGTIKNRMTVLRWWAQKVDRQNVIARQNDHYGIPEYEAVCNIDPLLGAVSMGRRNTRLKPSILVFGPDGFVGAS